MHVTCHVTVKCNVTPPCYVVYTMFYNMSHTTQPSKFQIGVCRIDTESDAPTESQAALLPGTGTGLGGPPLPASRCDGPGRRSHESRFTQSQL
jgi:hypothetical protein